MLWGRSGLSETPEFVKDEGRLKPPSFKGRQAKNGLCGQRLQTSCRGRNVDIPLAGARRLISRPRKASVFHLRWTERTFLDILFLTVFSWGIYFKQIALGYFFPLILHNRPPMEAIFFKQLLCRFRAHGTCSVVRVICYFTFPSL